MANTRNDLHGELDLMFQFDAQKMKTETSIIEARRREFQTQLK
jgi:hypothetical protein